MHREPTRCQALLGTRCPVKARSRRASGQWDRQTETSARKETHMGDHQGKCPLRPEVTSEQTSDGTGDTRQLKQGREAVRTPGRRTACEKPSGRRGLGGTQSRPVERRRVKRRGDARPGRWAGQSTQGLAPSLVTIQRTTEEH